MSRTKRNVPEAKLTEKEKKLAKKNKYHHPVDIKGEVVPHFSQNAKREAKREKHHKQRIETDKEIKEQISEE